MSPWTSGSSCPTISTPSCGSTTTPTQTVGSTHASTVQQYPTTVQQPPSTVRRFTIAPSHPSNGPEGLACDPSRPSSDRSSPPQPEPFDGKRASQIYRYGNASTTIGSSAATRN